MSLKIPISHVALSILLLASCGTPNAPEPGDPCAGKKLLKADFRICATHLVFAYHGDIPSQTVWIESDTLIAGERVGFQALVDADEYEWWIGEEVQPRLGWAVVVDFADPNKFRNRSFNATLIVRRSTIDSICLPGDKRADTLQKRFYLMPMYESLLPGQYFGTIKGPKPDTATVEIYYVERGEPPYQSRNYFVRNIQPGCWGEYRDHDPLIVHNYRSGNFSGQYSYPQFIGDSVTAGVCTNRAGWMSLTGDTLTIEYRTNPDFAQSFYLDRKRTIKGFFQYPKGTYTFVGKRIAAGRRVPGWRW